ncbi:MAG: glycine--tRNA ligase subunit beta [Armatimonadota bacterium]|jgi:glycyl-tRNA synthetase beta chain
MAKDALFEIGVEEIPAAFMPAAIRQMRELLERHLKQERLSVGSVATYGTPRRLAAVVTEVADSQPDVQQEIKGPPAAQAFGADGNATKAGLGFAKGRGVPVESLVTRDTPKGPWVFALVTETGRPAAEVLTELFDRVVREIRFPKMMRWGSGRFRFVRPIRWLVALLGTDVLDIEIEGLRAGNTSQPHRTLASGAVTVSSADAYLERLREGFVMADQDARREAVREAVQAAAEAAGGRARIDDELLTEVTHLVEWPTAVCGAFDEEYLSLPEDVLVIVMRKDQKYFPVEGDDGRLASRFVVVSNGGDEHLEVVRLGNERVLRARLADAAFYFEDDRVRSFEYWQDELKRVIFVEGAGSMHDKAQRLIRLAAWLSHSLSASLDVEAAALRAAEICKADLVSKMVTEPTFSELQGTMGGHYALLWDESELCATAVREHYLPTSAGGPAPETLASQIVSIADKMDSITACHLLGEEATGTEDPHALRRQAYGIVSIIIGQGLSISLSGLLDEALAALSDIDAQISPDEARERLLRLVDQRLEAVLEDAGIEYDVVRAVLHSPHDDLADAARRAELLSKKRDEWVPFADAVIAATRVANIVRPTDVTDAQYDAELFAEEEERALHEAFADDLAAAREGQLADDYEGLLARIHKYTPIIDAYFDEVRVVIEEDERRRENRLRFLRALDDVFRRLADFTEIVQ